jgi:hypothetical protein
MNRKSITRLTVSMMLAVMPGWSGAADSDIVFATVGDIEISRAEFEREVYTAARGTFYHGRVPEEDEFIEFRKGIAQQLIDRKLLIAEARQRELQPDDAGIEARLALYEDQYGETERWQVEGEQMIATLRAKFEEDSLLEVLEADIRAVSEPDESAARAFYEANPDLFTQPARRRVSLILLAVPPSATADTWGAARDEAARIVTQLEEGESFEDLASLHSSDVSAGAGGDMGFIHEGTLAADRGLSAGKGPGGYRDLQADGYRARKTARLRRRPGTRNRPLEKATGRRALGSADCEPEVVERDRRRRRLPHHSS